MGLATGCLVHTTLVAFGVSAIIQASDTLFLIIKILGAFYLFYLAYKVFKSGDQLDLSAEDVQKRKHLQQYRQGFIMNVLNPKVSIFFLAFFPGFLFSEALGLVTQFYILGLLFMLVTIVVFSSISLLSGSITRYTKEHGGIGRFFKWLQIIVFVGIGVFILLSEK